MKTDRHIVVYGDEQRFCYGVYLQCLCVCIVSIVCSIIQGQGIFLDRKDIAKQQILVIPRPLQHLLVFLTTAFLLFRFSAFLLSQNITFQPIILA